MTQSVLVLHRCKCRQFQDTCFFERMKAIEQRESLRIVFCFVWCSCSTNWSWNILDGLHVYSERTSPGYYVHINCMTNQHHAAARSCSAHKKSAHKKHTLGVVQFITTSIHPHPPSFGLFDTHKTHRPRQHAAPHSVRHPCGRHRPRIAS